MRAVELTVLGNASRYLAPLSGGSSYLVEAGDARILLDAGSGAAAALARTGVEALDAVVLSHFHWDHVSDLVPVRRAMKAGAPLVIPPGESARLDALAKAFVFDGAFDLDGPLVEARDALRVGPLALSFAPTQHSAPAFATRVEHAGRALVYASDTAPCEPLRALARGADLLLMHTLLPTVEADSGHARVHSTAESAGALAAQSGARRLLLSHRYHESPDAAMREAASTRFDGVELAREGATLEL